ECPLDLLLACVAADAEQLVVVVVGRGHRPDMVPAAAAGLVPQLTGKPISSAGSALARRQSLARWVLGSTRPDPAAVAAGDEDGSKLLAAGERPPIVISCVVRRRAPSERLHAGSPRLSPPSTPLRRSARAHGPPSARCGAPSRSPCAADRAG